MKQTSLFQSWTHINDRKPQGYSASVDQLPTLQPWPSESKDSDNDDYIINQALDQLHTSPLYNETDGMLTSLNRLHQHRTQINYLPTGNDSNHLDGYDMEAGQTWVYPVSSDHNVRNYQLNIVEQCLYKNTLVCLPTGLGKTFIAAVVLYNYLRWYPTGKVIFMAPTRPLVSQQFAACRHIIVRTSASSNCEDYGNITMELTGSILQALRQRMWSSSSLVDRDSSKCSPRAFFMTPQILTNDLQTGICPSGDIRLLVFDEAHKASGNHAYCQVTEASHFLINQVIRLLTSAPHSRRQFRIIALSATPAADVQGVQALIANLLISHLELRSDESSDLREFTQQRKLETFVVRLSAELIHFKDKLLDCLRVPVERLQRLGALPSSSLGRIDHLAKYSVVKAREAWSSAPDSGAAGLAPTMGAVAQVDFGMVICLLHALELLEQHGLRPVYHYLSGVLSGQRATTVVRNELIRLPGLQQVCSELTAHFTDASDSRPFSTQTPFLAGHPKLAKLKEILVEHFSSRTKLSSSASETRSIVFTQFRDSVDEIMHMLKQLRPLIRPASFIGQSSNAGRTTKTRVTLKADDATCAPVPPTAGISQRDQLRVMHAFRTGVFNVLVSTCIGEEGLDVGQVDLIICFDAYKSPIRLMQRLGRTGRRRLGRIAMLLTEGREEHNHRVSMSRQSSVSRALQDGDAYHRLAFYPHNPRMVPLGVEPRLTFHTMPIAGMDSTNKMMGDNSNASVPAVHRKQRVRLSVSTPVNEYQAAVQSHAEAIGLDHLKLRLDPITPYPLVSLVDTGCSPSPETRRHSHLTSVYQVTGARQLASTRRRVQARLSSLCRGPATSSLHLISLLRLVELHRRGATQLSYHALGLRTVDVDCTLSEADEDVDEVTNAVVAAPLHEEALSSAPNGTVSAHSRVTFTAQDVAPLTRGLVSNRIFCTASEPLLSADMSILEEAIHLLSREPISSADRISEHTLKSTWDDWLAEASLLHTEPMDLVSKGPVEFDVGSMSDWLDAGLVEAIEPCAPGKLTIPRAVSDHKPAIGISTTPKPAFVEEGVLSASFGGEMTNQLAAVFCLPTVKALPPSDSSTPRKDRTVVCRSPKVTLNDALALLDRSSLRLETSSLCLDSQAPVEAITTSGQPAESSAVFTTGMLPPVNLSWTGLQFGTNLALSDDFGQDFLVPTQKPQTQLVAEKTSIGEGEQDSQSSDLTFSSQINWSPVDLSQEGISDNQACAHSPELLKSSIEANESPLAPLRCRARQHARCRNLMLTQAHAEPISVQQSTPITIRRRHVNRPRQDARRFILSQAERTDDLSPVESSDNSDASIDAYEESFICDASSDSPQPSSRGGQGREDRHKSTLDSSRMMAVYLQSIRSPKHAGIAPFRRTRPAGRYPTANVQPLQGIPETMVLDDGTQQDICSSKRPVPIGQLYSKTDSPPLDDDDYQLDSFCVDEDFEESVLGTSESAEVSSPLRRRRRILISSSSSSSSFSD